ncbi:hypothetical protein [Algirhabdus cladophorae]|uniref:hypothetical protein n=1 Tax=Algirhabdus cladophorae TaxID=3377108 RepID=UPI003B8457F1
MVEKSNSIDQEVVKDWLESNLRSKPNLIGFDQALFLMSQASTRYTVTILFGDSVQIASEDRLQLLRSNLTAVLCSLLKSSALGKVAKNVFDANGSRPALNERRQENEQAFDTEFGILKLKSETIFKTIQSGPVEDAMHALSTVCWLTTHEDHGTPISPYFFDIVPKVTNTEPLFDCLKADFTALKGRELSAATALFSGTEKYSGKFPVSKLSTLHASSFSLAFDNSFRQPDFSFWIAWYDRLLDGKDIYAQELHDILITLTDEDWDKGPTHINPKFESVLLKYQEGDTFFDGEIVYDKETGKLQHVSEPIPEPDNTEIRQKMLFIAQIFEGEGGENKPYQPLDNQLAKIVEVASNDSSSTSLLWDACDIAIDITNAKTEEGECPKDYNVKVFLNQLRDTKRDIEHAAPRFREKVLDRKTTDQSLPDQSDEDLAIQNLSQAVEIVEAELQVKLIDIVKTAFDRRQPQIVRQKAVQELKAYLPRMISTWKKATDDATGLAKNVGTIAAAGIGTIAGSWLGLKWLWSFFFGL